MQSYQRAALFANGIPGDLNAIQINPQDFIVAVDGGLTHINSLKLVPNLVIGDLDSIVPGALSILKDQGVEILRYPIEKNQTDLELALYHVLALGFKRVVIIAGLGGRLDQTLGNIALLTNPDFEAIDLHMDDGKEDVFVIHLKASFSCQPNDIVSLLPLSTPVQGISTLGLFYPLNEETLYPHETRGISNIATGWEVTIQCSQGDLLCIHQRLSERTV